MSGRSPIDSVWVWFLRLVLVGALITMAGGLYALFRAAVAAEPAEVLMIVDQAGRPQLLCDMPPAGEARPLYMPQPHLAVVCHNPRRPPFVYRNGFEP